MLHAFLVLASEEAEKSETLFYVIGCLFAAWAVLIGTAGIRSESFGSERGLSSALIAVSVLLAAATGFAIVSIAG
jgi:hypothetical protein